MRDLGLEVAVDEIGNVVGTRAGTDPTAGAGDDRQPHRHRALPAAATTATSACSPAWRWSRRWSATACAPGTPWPSPSSPTRRAPASSPTCSAASCTSAAWRWRTPSTSAAIDGAARSATSWLASGTPGRCRARRRAPRTPSSSCTSSRARCWRPTACGIGAVTGVQGISWQELTIDGQSNHAGTTPMAMRHDAALRRRRGSRRSCAELATELGRPPGRHRRRASSSSPTWSTWWPAGPPSRVDLRNTDDAILHEAERRLREHGAGSWPLPKGSRSRAGARWPASSR